MKIAVLGSGSIGLYYGAKLAAAGEDVHFLLRSGYDEAAKDGIHIFSPEGNVRIHPVHAHRDAGSIGTCDLVVIALKTTQNALLDGLIPPILGPDTMLLTLQNGLGSDDALATRYGAERVLGALCFVCLTRRTPAQVDHFGHGVISIGEYGRPPQARTEDLADRFRRAGVETRVVADLAGERWKKLVWNIPFNGLSITAGGVAVDRLLADPTLEAEVRALMEEVIRAAAALGHPIRPDFAEFQIERTRTMGAYQPSTLVDYLAGRELEVDSIWGEPLRRAIEAGVHMPHLEKLLARLLEIETARSTRTECR
ncbi:MAG TPA: 2-dehydropantoate 2-reductase [Chthoniobacterales bacterium]